MKYNILSFIFVVFESNLKIVLRKVIVPKNSFCIFVTFKSYNMKIRTEIFLHKNLFY